jgi:catechol 2,3-dioxygenase-like lactoylglutathione lyase family enzyme
MTTAIRHVGLVVADLEKSLKFWCDTMGFVVSRQMEESGPHIDAMMGLKDVRVTTAKLAASDGNLLELLCFHSHPDKQKWEGKPYSTGLTHIALTVQDLDETLGRLKLLGASVPAEPQLSPDGQVKVIYASGPEGVLLELVEVIKK